LWVARAKKDVIDAKDQITSLNADIASMDSDEKTLKTALA